MFTRSNNQKQKSFKELIEETNTVFTEMIEKLRSISSCISTEISNNNDNIAKLTEKNFELHELKNKSDRQIDQISRLIE